MKTKHPKRVATLLGGVISMLAAASLAGHPDNDRQLDLSPQLSGLLRAEMAALSQGIQLVALALASADWAAIQETSGKMHDSYIMKKSLTPALAAELKEKLPAEFKQLDAAFHARALKLQHAAEKRDLELSMFHFSRLLATCAGCHAEFAGDRFPGFRQGPPTASH